MAAVPPVVTTPTAVITPAVVTPLATPAIILTAASIPLAVTSPGIVTTAPLTLPTTSAVIVAPPASVPASQVHPPSSASTVSSSSAPPNPYGNGNNVNNASNQNHGPPSNNNLKVIVPIATVACILVIIYILYRIYLLHKGRKEQNTPLPPPRTPAIFEQRRPQSMMMYGQPQMAYAQGMAPGMGNTPPSYRQSMRPVSFMYDAGQSNSSLSKGLYYHGSGSGHSTPSPFDDNTLERPFRPGARPHSVASFGSSQRTSQYLRNSPHASLRGEIILPQPLSAAGTLNTINSMHSSSSHHHQHAPITGRGSRYSMFNAPTEFQEYNRPLSSADLRPPSAYPDLRQGYSSRQDSFSDLRVRPQSAIGLGSHSSNLPPSLTLPSIPRTREDDWTERMALAVADVESNSTCTAHQHPEPSRTPPPPLPPKPTSTRDTPTPTGQRQSRAISPRDTAVSSPPPSATLGRESTPVGGATTPSSFSGHIPGAFPSSPVMSPTFRGRSVSPPEPLLSGAFINASASGSAESK